MLVDPLVTRLRTIATSTLTIRQWRFLQASLLVFSAFIVSLPVANAQSFNIFEDRDTFTEFLGNALACRLSEELTVDAPRTPLFSATDDGCIATDTLVADQDNFLFADSECTNAIVVTEQPQQQFCTLALDPLQLGVGTGLPTFPHNEWAQTPGTRFDIGAASLEGLNSPYVQQVTYKQVLTDSGVCDLEMRIYKNDLAATGLKSLVALHGGSWRARGFGFFGLEMTVPQFTAQDYVVFAPFYRLIDTREGPPACHGATIDQVREDAASALQWVIDNAASYGANDFPTVFGQSAGAHLSTSLVADFPEQIANAVLFYPPTDFTEFGLRILDGSYTNEQGLGILRALLGVEPEAIDVSATPIPENTFPSQILPIRDTVPPVFMLHGLADELVEATQSTLLCGALGGDVSAIPDRDFWMQQPDLRHIIECDDRGSQLHLILEGDHALDVCFTNNILLQDLCLSGSQQSRQLVASSINDASSWAALVAEERLAERDVQTANGAGDEVAITTAPQRSGGSGALTGFVLLILNALYFSRRRTHTESSCESKPVF